MNVVMYARERYCLHRALANGSEYQIIRSCKILEAWMLREGFDPLVEVPDELELCRWVKYLELIYLPRTAFRIRADVLGVLNDAADCGLRAAIRPRRVRRPLVDPPMARAWTIETVQKIICGMRKLDGTMANGLRRSVYMECIYRCAWCLGLRRRDLWAMPLSAIHADGRAWTLQGKTRVLTFGRLGAGELNLLHSFGLEKPLAFPHSKKTFYDWSDLGKAYAGIDEPGYLHRIRKSAATDIAKKQGRAAATKFLGHTNPKADAHYIDESLLDESPIEPTALDLSTRILAFPFWLTIVQLATDTIGILA